MKENCFNCVKLKEDNYCDYYGYVNPEIFEGCPFFKEVE